MSTLSDGGDTARRVGSVTAPPRQARASHVGRPTGRPPAQPPVPPSPQPPPATKLYCHGEAAARPDPASVHS